MNRYFNVPTFFLTVALLFIFSNANSEEVNIFHGVQYGTVSKSKLLSGTMTLNKDGGVFKTLIDSGDVLALTPPGEKIVSVFKLPDRSENINLTIDFYASNDSVKGQISWNGVLLSDKEYELRRKNAQKAFSSVSFLLKGAQAQNELKIYSVNGELCIHRIKIDYDYSVPSCSKHDVTVVLTSPVSNDVVQQDMRFEWKTIGDSKNGWISLQYEDNGSWKTVPGAELLDCQAKKTCGKYGEYIWKNHGLSAIPKFQIEYHDYKKDSLPDHFSREMRPFVLEKSDSINGFRDLINKFIDEDLELLNTVKYTYDKITIFNPTEQNIEERACRLSLKTLAARLVNTQSIEKKIAALEEERKKKDLDVDYKLLNIEAINKELRFFKTLVDSIEDMSQSIQNRIDDLNQYIPNRIEEETSKQKKVLVAVENKFKEFRLIVYNKKMEYISFSVVSPYLADAHRAFYWKLPNYSKKISMLCLMNKYKWIHNSCLNVKKQYEELLEEYSKTYPKIQELKEEWENPANNSKPKK